MSKEIPPFLSANNNLRKLRKVLLLDRFLQLFIFRKDKSVRPKEIPRKILYIQSHLIGDLVMATPPLKALRKHYPASAISLLANGFARELFEEGEIVDRIYTISFPWAFRDYSVKNLWHIAKVIKHLRNEVFDLAIDGQIDCRNALLMFLIGAKRRLGYDITGGRIFLTEVPDFPQHMINMFEARFSLLQALGIDTSDKTAKIAISAESRNWTSNFLASKNISDRKLVAIHPGASVREKLWQPGKFAQVIGYLAENGYAVVIIEGPKDGATVREIMAGCQREIPVLKSSLKNMAAFLSRCQLLICLDSAAFHLAYAVNTPAIALYGPMWPQSTQHPSDKSHIIWVENFDCRPCDYGRCKRMGESCMDAIGAEEVIKKIKSVLTSRFSIFSPPALPAEERTSAHPG